jgi:hypothetical protein
LATIDRFSNFSRYFYVFQVVEHIIDSFRMFALKNETFKKQSKNFIFGQFCQF